LKIVSKILPCSLLSSNTRACKEYDEIVGVHLVNWLFDRYKYTNDGKEKHQEGIVPFNKLWVKDSEARFENHVILLGRGPSNCYVIYPSEWGVEDLIM